MRIILSEDLEFATPIRVYDDCGCDFLTFREARELLMKLDAAVGKIEKHFQCADENGTKSAGPFRCPWRGSVKINGKWYCKRHAKGIA